MIDRNAISYHGSFCKVADGLECYSCTWDSHGSGSSDCKAVNSDTNTKTQVQNVDCTSCKVSAMDM